MTERKPGRPKGGIGSEEGGNPATRRLLLDAAAAQLVAANGVLEMAEVAARAEVSVGLAYHYFGSKAGLLGAVVDDFYDRYDETVIAPNPLPGADWGTRERQRVRNLVAFFYREPLAPIVLGRLAQAPEVATVEAARIARNIALGARNVQLAQARGQIPPNLDPHLIVAMMMGGLRQAIGQALARTPRPRATKLTDELWDCVTALARYRGPHEGPDQSPPTGEKR